MGKLEDQWLSSSTRRTALRSLVTTFVGGSTLLRGQQDPYRDHSRVPAMNELVSAFDFEAVAFAKLPRDAYDYTALGVEDEFTLRRNRQAFEWVELIPRAIVDVSSVQTATDVLGTRMAFPIMIAPTASHLSLHPEGEVGTHQGATAASNTPFIISNNASLPLAKIAKAAAGPIWFQLYPKETLQDNQEAIEIAQNAGCKAIVLTYDGASGESLTGPRERALHDRHLESRRLEQDANGGGDSTRVAQGRRARRPRKYGLTGNAVGLDWKFVDAVRAVTKVPFLTKGILTGEDAKACVEHGLSGIVVSNHGGRAMDYGPATLEVLAEVVDGAEGRIPVIIDGGFRRGTDVLKALALGAKAVCLGRVPRWGLAAYGPAGAQRILEIVQGELVMAMAATGRPSLESINRTLVKTDF
jgi:isopentenyl diphosphate isomerase/L-lactate dehydrogenase-like FMN-dependent dehydrogenase